MTFNKLMAAATIVTTGVLAGQVRAAFDLRITEIWSGQDGADITEDWIEVTNYGDLVWTAATDGDLYVEDASGSDGITDAVLVQGLTGIAPGESVIILFEDDGTGAATFNAAWGDPGVSVGYADGGGIGLGGSGDDSYLFLAGGTLLDSAGYPDTGGSPTETESWDVLLGTWSTIGNASDAYASTALGGAGADTPAIGSPGAIVPEPAALMLIGLSGLAAMRRH
ncbi:MAG: hypothetical protein R3C45_22145 [Phycisphaerales bacterium]